MGNINNVLKAWMEWDGMGMLVLDSAGALKSEISYLVQGFAVFFYIV